MSAIDLRSDTVTRPTPGMLRAMMSAEVGDDVLGDDPTVRRLQEAAAEFLGQEAALFFPTGTMANTVAYRTWSQPGDEVICDSRCHTYRLETAAGAALCGLSFCPVETPDGILTAEKIEPLIQPWHFHRPASRIIEIENTHNLAGGTCYPLTRVKELGRLAHAHKLVLHMDGARLANAAIAMGVTPADYGRCCDSVAQCLSKGLGCPAGTVLAGPKEFIERALRFRKMFGGGMRQAGYLAAAGLYALQHHVQRLAEDHAHARRLAQGIAGLDGISLDVSRVVTNMVYFRFTHGPAQAKRVVERLKDDGVLISLMGPDLARAVTHLDVDTRGIDRAVDAIRRALQG